MIVCTLNKKAHLVEADKQFKHPHIHMTSFYWRINLCNKPMNSEPKQYLTSALILNGQLANGGIQMVTDWSVIK